MEWGQLSKQEGATEPGSGVGKRDFPPTWGRGRSSSWLLQRSGSDTKGRVSNRVQKPRLSMARSTP